MKVHCLVEKLEFELVSCWAVMKEKYWVYHLVGRKEMWMAEMKVVVKEMKLVVKKGMKKAVKKEMK